MDSCPKELEPYEKAHRIKKMENDALMHLWWGTYGLSAVSVALEHNLAGIFGKKGQSKYIESSIYQDIEKGTEITEEEKQRQVDLFFAQERARRINWKRNHLKDDAVS